MNETLDRHYWRDRAMHVLPGATPRQIVRAARILKLQYDAPVARYDAIGSTLPTWEYAPGTPKPSQEGEDLRDVKPTTVAAPYLSVLPDARAFDGRVGGGVPNLSPAPDAWSAIQSTVGVVNGVNKVIRRGHARVQGATVSIDDTPSGMSPGLLAQVLADLPRNSIGVEGWRVSIVADLFYGADDQLPGQGGHDTLQQGESVPSGVDLSMVRGVVRGDSDGADKHMSWPLRTRLPRVVLRKSEQVFLKPGALIAPHADRSKLFVGHQAWTRGKHATRPSRGGKREARTVFVGTAIALDTPAALATLCEGINRGERVAVRFNGVAITITRGKGDQGTWSVTTPAGKANGLRTPGNVGKRAWELVS